MKRALVIGCGARVWADVEEAQQMCRFDEFYICKLAGVSWDGGYFHWITLHPEFMKVPRLVSTGEAGYCIQRAQKGYHSNYEIVSPLIDEVGAHRNHRMDRHVTYRWPGMSSSGSTGLFAVKIALDDGCDRVVLAGVPMTDDKHFSRGKPWNNVGSFTNAWETALPYYKDKTRSVSGGYTERLLGRPTPEWLGVSSSNEAGAIPETEAARG